MLIAYGVLICVIAPIVRGVVLPRLHVHRALAPDRASRGGALLAGVVFGLGHAPGAEVIR